jgi:hypothetical protein
MTAETVALPRFATVKDWCRLSGMGRTVTYERIAAGDLRAVKLGARVLIDVPAGLTWLSALPPAQIHCGQRKAA